MKREIVIGIVMVIVLIAVIMGFYLLKAPATLEKSSGSNSGQGTVSGEGSIVAIKNFKFNPTTVNIKVGETVTWTNEDSAPHQIATDSGNELASESISTGGTYSHIFNIAGTYEYHCAIHTSMKGKVVVS